MTSWRVPFVLVLCATGCAPENKLTDKNAGPDAFDTGDEFTAPVDSADETADTDTGEVTVPTDKSCESRLLLGEPVPQDVECEGGPAQPDWELEVVWEKALMGTYSPVVVGQLDDDDGDGDVDADDTPDIIALDGAANLYSLNGVDGSVNWQLSLTNTTNVLSAVGDVNGDGFPDVLTDVNYTLVALDGSTGDTIWTGPPSSGKNKGTCGAVGMADLDADGSPEAYLGSMVVDGTTGTMRGNGDEGDGLGVGNYYGHSVAADLDDDGLQEVVVGNAAYDADGNTIWSNGESDGTVAIADLDEDGSPEIISVNSSGVTVMDNEGGVLWTLSLGSALPSTPVAADLDGDGAPEVIIPTSESVVVLNASGDEIWTVEATGTAMGRGGASAYDLDGDGAWEVIWASSDGTQILDGATGSQLAEYAGAQTSCSGPVPVVDLDHDNKAELVVIDSTGKLRVLRDTHGFTDARTQWHQSDYSVTNVEDDGSLPVAPEPNWKGVNNFRAGEPVTQVQSLYPVVRDVCSDECETSGSVWIWYSIANSGYYTMDGRVEVEIWGTTDAGSALIGTDTFSGSVPAGMMSDARFLELVDVPQPLYDIEVRITDTSNPDLEPCATFDARDSWGLPICE